MHHFHAVDRSSGLHELHKQSRPAETFLSAAKASLTTWGGACFHTGMSTATMPSEAWGAHKMVSLLVIPGWGWQMLC